MPRIPTVISWEQIFAVWGNLTSDKANQVFDNINNITYNWNWDVASFIADTITYNITYTWDWDMQTITDWTNTWEIQYNNDWQIYNIIKY